MSTSISARLEPMVMSPVERHRHTTQFGLLTIDDDLDIFRLTHHHWISMQDPPGKDEAERHRFLEEIRKKAEEAELKRLEEEERKATLRHTASLPRPTPMKEDPAVEQKITDLRGRLSIALDRGKTERASQLLDELSTLVKDDSEIALARQRIAVLEMEQDREKERVTKEGAGAEKAVKLSESQKRKIADLLESADQAYQYEQYERGLRTVQEILSVDPENSSAIELQRRIEAAQLLSDQIKEEEARRKAEEAKLFEKEQPKQVPVTPPQGADAWGSLDVAPGEQHTFGGEMGTVPVAPPRLPLGRRIKDSLASIHIPPKLIITSVAVIILGVLVYVVVDQLRARVSLPKYSVLILPAQSAVADSGAQYIAAGLTTDLIDDLASVPDLRVFAATTSMSLRDSRGTATQIARTLGANYLLQWSVTRSAEGVAIQLHFSDTLSQQPLLSNQYQSSFRELPALRLEIARLLAREIGLDSAALGSELVRPPPTSVPAAYDAYLHGRASLLRGDSSSIWNALSAFEAACQADSNFADAFAAVAWTRLRAYDEEIDTASVQIETASFAIDHASALHSRSAEMYRAKGMLEQLRGRYERALQQVERAVAAAPSDAESQRRLSVLYVARNRPDDALKAARRAAADDPRNVASFTMLGLVQQLRGEYGDALNSYREGMRLVSDSSEYASSHYADLLVYTLQPDQAIGLLADRVARSRQSYLDYYRLGRAYQISGKPKQEWERALQRSKELLTEKLQSNPEDAIALTYLALVYTRLGEIKDAGDAVTRAKLIGGEAPDVLYNLARVYAVRRDIPQAIDYLSKALDRRYSLATILNMDFYNLRSEPVFLRTITRY